MHNIQSTDELAEQFKRFHQRISSLERAAHLHGSGGGVTVSGSRGGNAALASLIAALAALGLVTDSTTP